MGTKRFSISKRTEREGAGDTGSGDISHLMFVTFRPGIQVLWTILVVSVVIYVFATDVYYNPWILGLMLLSYTAVLALNWLFPFDRYRPAGFFILMMTTLVLITTIVYFTGNKTSLLAFLFFIPPIYAAHYYSYSGTLLVAAFTSLARALPFMTGTVTGVQYLTLALSATAYFVVGFLTCYIVEGQKVYARESREFRKLLDISRDREREVSVIYNLGRKFSYTLDLDTILKTTAALARKTLASEGTLVFLYEDSRPVLKAALGILPFSDISGVELPTEQEWCVRLSAGENVVANKTALDWLPLHPGTAGRIHNLAAVPLLLGGETIGYLICFSPETRVFRQSHLDILSTLASQASVAVEKARLYADTVDEKTKIETILSALRDGLLVTDAHGLLVQANPIAEQLLGVDSSALGRNVVDILSGSLSSADFGLLTMEEALEAALAGRSIFGEMELEGDARVTVQAHYIPLKDQMAGISGVVLFLHDITELKRIDEMKSNFVSNVSHELRTPLTSITGFVSLLIAGRAGPLSPQQESYLEVVREQTDNLTQMIEDLLDLSRIMAQGKAVSAGEVDVIQVIESSLGHLRSKAIEKDVEIKVGAGDGLPQVSADPARLEQVVTNILGNAIKFTDPGGLVEVNALENGPFVQVQVTDNGPGIPQSALPHIFDRFFQAHSGGSRETGGFGLGLAISREIIELHRGSIWVESEEGQGSTFYFTVPIYHRK